MSSIDLGSNNDLGPAAITSTDVRPTSASVENIVSRAGMAALASAIGAGASAAVTNRPEQPMTTNALSVLLAALPSDVRSSLLSDFETTQTVSTSTRPTPPSTTQTTTRTSSLTTLFTSARASSTSSSTLAATTTAAPPADPQQISNGTIAGVATGVVAGAVLLILGIVLIIRRRRQGQAPFGPRGSQRSQGSGRAYPEVAWLYDPAPTPPNEPSHRREESAASLLPQIPRTPGTTAAGRPGPPLESSTDPNSPLLPPPHMPFARAESPGASPPPGASPSSSRTSSPRSGGRRSARSSATSSEARRPLHAIFEESHTQ